MPGTCSVDTSPLLYLFRIGKLPLLRRHYERVLVPQAVVAELESGRAQGVEVPGVSDFPWIEIRETELRPVSAAVAALGNGEREVILLALDHHADWVILDDLEARRQAEGMWSSGHRHCRPVGFCQTEEHDRIRRPLSQCP